MINKPLAILKSMSYYKRVINLYATNKHGQQFKKEIPFLTNSKALHLTVLPFFVVRNGIFPLNYDINKHF